MDEAGLEALLSRVALGDRPAFERLYARTAPRLHALCLRVVGNRREAEAALADAYVRIWRYAERFPAAGVTPTTWLSAIARHHAIERLRVARAPAAILKTAESVAGATARADRKALARAGHGSFLDEIAAVDADAAQLVRVAYFGGATYGSLAQRDGRDSEDLRLRLRQAFAALLERRGPVSIERDTAASAVEYVLALMDEAERRTFERAMLDDPALAAAVWRAEAWLAPLCDMLRPRRSPGRVWRAIVGTALTAGDPVPPRRVRLALARWRALAGFFAVATVGAVCLLAIMALRPDVLVPTPAAMVSALVSPDGRVTMARLTGDGSVRAAPYAGALEEGLDPVLWLRPAAGEPIALGVLSPDAPTVLTDEELLTAGGGDLSGARLEVTAEPDGSHPGAQPTGRTLATGTVERI